MEKNNNSMNMPLDLNNTGASGLAGISSPAILNALMDTTVEGVILVNSEDRITMVNPAIMRISGYSHEELIGQRPGILKSERHDKDFFAAMWNEIEKHGRWNGEIWNRRKNGEIFRANLTIIKITKQKNPTTHYLGVLTDLSRFSSDTHEQSYYDVITGLANRVLLSDRLDFMIAHAKRNSQILAVLLIDLDRFKHTNDTLGYSAGDSILQTVSARLIETVREVDAVFRLGNDEFAVVLEEIAQTEDAAKVAKKLLKSVFDEPVQPAGSRHEILVRASIGISFYPHDASDKESLLKNAEAAMYRAKEKGENSFEHYTPQMNSRALEALNLEYRLHKALKQNEFLVFYQPLIDLHSARIMGAEALIRWKHPDMGMVSPGEFIPIAEENGLIVPIGEWVMFTACEHAKKWQDKKLANVRVSVNLSARQFQQRDLIKHIDSALKHSKLDPTYLALEITESLGMKNAEKTIRTLQKLKDMGIFIAIDDFGTGYSSLNYLKRFPVDILKIDQSFVRDIGSDTDDETIVSIIISMAHALKLKVLAEGVESSKQMDFLWRHKCDLLQGYLFSPPLAVEEFETLLKKTKGKMK